MGAVCNTGHTHTYTHIHTYTHTHIHTDIQTQTQTDTDTETHTNLSPQLQCMPQSLQSLAVPLFQRLQIATKLIV